MRSKKFLVLGGLGAVAALAATAIVALPSPDSSRSSGSSGSSGSERSSRSPGSPSRSAASGAIDATATSAGGRAAPVLPAVYLADPATLASDRSAYRRGDAQVSAPIALLIKRANKDLAVRPVSVMAKSQVPPKGTRHDYLSLSVYAWPDPHKSNGLPYVIRDGQRNPGVDAIPDKANLVNVTNWSQELAYAYYFTGNEAYAAKATTILSTWFLDPATRMDPNLAYAQGVPGRSSGQAGGIIDAADLPQVIDAAGLLAGSPAWTASDLAALKSWFSSYLSWLQTSSDGRSEAAASNNHATWYDDQAVSYALFVGNPTLARSIANSAKTKIIEAQLTSAGKQPKELARTDTWSYSTYNLAALAELAQLANRAGVDLWSYQAANGATIRKALDFVLQYVDRMPDWPYPQSRAGTMQYLAAPLYAAASAYHSASYASAATAAAASLPASYPALSLMYPPP